MTITERLTRVLAHEPMNSEAWSQPQREALMDLVLLGMYVDGKVSTQEIELLGKSIDHLTDETGMDWDAYAADALKKMYSFDGKPEERHLFVQRIGERLGDEEKRRLALQELNTMLEIDGRVPVEKTFLEEVKAVFLLKDN